MEKIQTELIKIGDIGFKKGIIVEGENLNNWIRTRNSLIYKLKFLEISLELLNESLDYIKNKCSLIDPQETRKIYDICAHATFVSTYHIECFIYHLLSSLDNLKAILPYFYLDLSINTGSMRQMYKSIIKQEKLKETYLRQFVESNENKWLITINKNEGLYGYRGEIYHWLSNLCSSQTNLVFPSKNFSYDLKVSLPDRLSTITGYEKEININLFIEKLIEDYKRYVLNLIISIEKDLNI